MTAVKVKKNYFITGVCDEESLAWRTMLELFTRKGDEVGWVVLSVWISPNTIQRVKDLVATLSQSWQDRIRIIALDISSEEQLGIDEFAPSGEAELNRVEQLVFEAVGERIRFSGVLHAVARGGKSIICQPDEYLDASWDDYQQAYKVSAFSYLMLLKALYRILEPGGSAVALSFSSEEPNYKYGMMGDLKAGLERLTKNLAVHLGKTRQFRVNVCSGSVVETKAAKKGIPGFGWLQAWFRAHSILKDDNGENFVRTIVTMLAGDLPGVTGETIYADNGLKHGECCSAEEGELLAA